MKNIVLAIVLFTSPLLALAQCSVSLQSTAVIPCKGRCNGALFANITSGTGPYSYSWSPNVSSTANASGLCAGTYTVVTTDNFGCTATDKIVLAPGPQAISVNATVSPA